MRILLVERKMDLMMFLPYLHGLHQLEHHLSQENKLADVSISTTHLDDNPETVDQHTCDVETITDPLYTIHDISP